MMPIQNKHLTEINVSRKEFIARLREYRESLLLELRQNEVILESVIRSCPDELDSGLRSLQAELEKKRLGAHNGPSQGEEETQTKQATEDRFDTRKLPTLGR